MNTLQLSEEEKKKLYITQFDLSARCHNILREVEIDLLGQLAEKKRSDMFKYRNIGKKTMDELDNLLHQNGLKWKDEDIIPVPILRTPIIEGEIIRDQEKLKSENRRLRSENEKLRDDKLKSNLEKLRLEGQIKDMRNRLYILETSILKDKKSTV